MGEAGGSVESTIVREIVRAYDFKGSFLGIKEGPKKIEDAVG